MVNLAELVDLDPVGRMIAALMSRSPCVWLRAGSFSEVLTNSPRSPTEPLHRRRVVVGHGPPVPETSSAEDRVAPQAAAGPVSRPDGSEHDRVSRP